MLFGVMDMEFGVIECDDTSIMAAGNQMYPYARHGGGAVGVFTCFVATGVNHECAKVKVHFIFLLLQELTPSLRRCLVEVLMNICMSRN